ncbi:MAG: hypothetical protein A3E83_09255 [Gammaproteobacteria bacterium RIFCSPHIGHO2_12_FULL_41_20]|nr:MAG: hypothetical protein A3E83_09255 [Gammaproteobacteria bacterium RIFCSPHIGHO2_12_FULL_41_20]
MSDARQTPPTVPARSAQTPSQQRVDAAAATQTPIPFIEAIPLEFRYLFEKDGPFKVIDKRMGEFARSLSAALSTHPSESTAPVASAKPKPTAQPAASGLAAIFQEAGFELQLNRPTISQVRRELFLEDNPIKLLAMFIEKTRELDSILLFQSQSAPTTDVAEIHQQERTKLQAAFSTWNLRPKSDPITDRITTLKKEIAEETLAKQRAATEKYIHAEKFSELVRSLFTIEGEPPRALFKLIPTGESSSVPEDACIQHFNSAIEDFFSGKTDTASAPQVLSKGWKLVSDYKPETGSSVNISFLFFNKLLPALHNLKQKLDTLAQLEKSLSILDQATQAYRETTLQSALANIRATLPQLLAGAQLDPVQDSIAKVMEKIMHTAPLKMTAQIQAQTREAARSQKPSSQRLTGAIAQQAAAAAAASQRLFSAAATTTAQPTSLSLRPYVEFTDDEPTQLYGDNGYLNTYKKQAGATARVPEQKLQELDNIWDQYWEKVANHSDQQCIDYKYILWNHLASQIQEGTSPDAAIETCIDQLRRAVQQHKPS